MCIRVKAKKVMVDDEQYVEVTDIKALTKDDLPKKYVKCWPSAWKHCTKDILHIYHGGFIKTDFTGAFIKKNEANYLPVSLELSVGDRIEKSAFSERMAFLSKCGDRLTQINKQAKELDWQGEIDVKI